MDDKLWHIITDAKFKLLEAALDLHRDYSSPTSNQGSFMLAIRKMVEASDLLDKAREKIECGTTQNHAAGE